MDIIHSLLAFDLSLLEQARALISPQYVYLVQVCGEFIVIYTALLLMSLWLIGVYKKDNEYKRIAIALCITIISVFVLYMIINLGIPKWRPGATEIASVIPPLIPHPIDNSFPSGHALFTGALLVALFQYYRRSWLIVLTILIGMITLMARVFGGVHYPGDIIAGLIFGILGVYILRPVVDRVLTFLTPYLIKIASWIHL